MTIDRIELLRVPSFGRWVATITDTDGRETHLRDESLPRLLLDVASRSLGQGKGGASETTPHDAGTGSSGNGRAMAASVSRGRQPRPLDQAGGQAPTPGAKDGR